MIIEIILLIITIAIFLLIHDIVEMAKIIKKLQLRDKEIMDAVDFIGENMMDEVRERIEENRDESIALLDYLKLDVIGDNKKEGYTIVKIKKTKK